MAYLLDTNVLIAAKNNYYGFEFCPAFWEWLDIANAVGTVRSVERVYDGLLERGDELSDWAHTRRAFFLSLTADDIPAIAEVNRWATDSPDYDPAAKDAFADVADSFLSGASEGRTSHNRHARALSAMGVSGSRSLNAAAAHGVDWCTPFHMLKVERPRLVLERAS